MREQNLMTVGPKGQVVIPQEVRKLTGIAPSMQVEVNAVNGKVVIQKHTENLSTWLEEQVKKHGRPLAKLDMDSYYEEQLEEKMRRSIPVKRKL